MLDFDVADERLPDIYHSSFLDVIPMPSRARVDGPPAPTTTHFKKDATSQAGHAVVRACRCRPLTLLGACDTPPPRLNDNWSHFSSPVMRRRLHFTYASQAITHHTPMTAAGRRDALCHFPERIISSWPEREESTPYYRFHGISRAAPADDDKVESSATPSICERPRSYLARRKTFRSALYRLSALLHCHDARFCATKLTTAHSRFQTRLGDEAL